MFYECKLAPRTWLTFGTGPGLYRHKGNDPDLGSAVEFASWIEVTTIVFNRRIGLGF
ncbi:MAG: hypothetical protein Q7S40_03230 [Opitutaceae bacterium]|nr:hypothetical protein [Opitutaceae bacterium]